MPSDNSYMRQMHGKALGHDFHHAPISHIILRRLFHKDGEQAVLFHHMLACRTRGYLYSNMHESILLLEAPARPNTPQKCDDGEGEYGGSEKRAHAIH